MQCIIPFISVHSLEMAQGKGRWNIKAIAILQKIQEDIQAVGSQQTTSKPFHVSRNECILNSRLCLAMLSFQCWCTEHLPRVADYRSSQGKSMEMCSIWKHVEDCVSLPSDCIEPPTQHSRTHVAPRRGHAGDCRPRVSADVIGFHRGQMSCSIKPTDNVDVIIQQSHSSPCKHYIDINAPGYTGLYFL